MLILITAANGQYTIDRSAGKRPDWINIIPEEYFIGIGTHTELSSAMRISKGNAYKELFEYLGIKLKDSVISFNGDLLIDKIGWSGPQQLVKEYRVIEMYWELMSKERNYGSYNSKSEGNNLQYIYYTLIGKGPSRQPPSNLIAGSLSMLVPGAGQYYKGQSSKGFWIFFTEAILVSSYFALSVISQNYKDEAFKQQNVDSQDHFMNLSNIYSTGAKISGGLAIVIYLVNIIDAFTVDGESSF
jgi:hypothetical protein